jgi:hypothetical protein
MVVNSLVVEMSCAFTGDPGGIDGARGIADWTLRTTPVLAQGMERQLGHALMTCNDTFEATSIFDGENTSHAVAERERERSNVTRRW